MTFFTGETSQLADIQTLDRHVWLCGASCGGLGASAPCGFQPLRPVGKGLDGELAQLVRPAGLTSAQTDAVIPTGAPLPSGPRTLKPEFRGSAQAPRDEATPDEAILAQLLPRSRSRRSRFSFSDIYGSGRGPGRTESPGALQRREQTVSWSCPKAPGRSFS